MGGTIMRNASAPTRLLAFFIDFAVIAALSCLPVVGRSEVVGPEEAAWEYWAWFVILGLPYFTLAESSPWQGTLGKKLPRLQVSTLQGERIGFLRASLRYFARVTSYPLFFFVGFMFAVTAR